MELECGYSPKQLQSYLFWLPQTNTGPARSLLEIYPWERTLQWDALASSPILQTLIINYYRHTHICTHFPSPHPSPPPLWTRQPDRRVCGQCREWPQAGRLPAGAGSLPLLQSVSMVYVLLLRCFFPVLTLYSPRSIVWGLFFFSSLSSCYAVIFFNSLSSCPVYPLVIYVCYVWAGWWLISLVLVTKWQ